MKQTTFEEFVELSKRGTFVPVCREIMADLLTPVSAFLKIAEHSDYAFLLESVEGGERLARYSFIGFGDCLEVKLDRDGFTLGRERRPVPQTSAELFAALRDALARSPHPKPDMAGVPLAGGLVGYASYDIVRFFERLPLSLAAVMKERDPAREVIEYEQRFRRGVVKHRKPTVEW